jgi:hypothetical protein
MHVSSSVQHLSRAGFNFRRTSSWLLFEEEPSRVSGVGGMHGAVKTRSEFEWRFLYMSVETQNVVVKAI